MKAARGITIIFILSVLLLTGRVAYLVEASRCVRAGTHICSYNTDLVLDDAYISFRYAANFANGQGLVYNLGERVEGYTNFLWTLLLGVGRWSGMEIPILAQVLTGAAGIGVLLVMAAFARRWLKDRPDSVLLAGLPMLLFAGLGGTARFVFSGMETLFFTFLAVLSVYFFLYNNRAWLIGGIFAVCALTRPEGILLFLICLGFGLIYQGCVAGGAYRFHHKRLALELLAGFCLLYLPYFIARWVYFGYPLPNTYYAKVDGLSWQRLERGWMILSGQIGAWGLIPLLMLAMGSLFSVKREPYWLLLVVLVAAFFGLFVMIGGDFYTWFGPRLLMPVLPFFLWMTAEGIYNLTRLPFIPSMTRAPLQAALGALLLGYVIWFSWPAHASDLEPLANQMHAWKELGIWMKANLPANAWIATDAAGLIPYYSRLRSIDMFGLTDVHIAHLQIHQPGAGIAAHEKYDPTYILARKPDCIVATFIDSTGQPLSAGLPMVAGQFMQNYHLVAVAKSRGDPPLDGHWVLGVKSLQAEQFHQGYQSGLFCLK